jgi:hypothetical protein
VNTVYFEALNKQIAEMAERTKVEPSPYREPLGCNRTMTSNAWENKSILHSNYGGFPLQSPTNGSGQHGAPLIPSYGYSPFSRGTKTSCRDTRTTLM